MNPKLILLCPPQTSKNKKNGHTKTTFKFYREVFQSSNLIGIFAGHIHRNSIEVIKGKPQIVSDDNASGGYLDIDFIPMEDNFKI